MLRKIYLSPLGFFISLGMHFFALFRRKMMVYGFFNKVDGKFYKQTRVSSSAILSDKKKIDIKDNVWVGHYCLLDGIGGITIAPGVHIASHSCIYTHSSHNAIRLAGEKFIEIAATDRPGYIIEPVTIGEYTFIGTSCAILSGTTVGKACVIGAGSVVKGNFPDYSVIAGNPAKIIGDTKAIDKKLFEEGHNFENYFEKDFLTGKKSQQ